SLSTSGLPPRRRRLTAPCPGAISNVPCHPAVVGASADDSEAEPVSGRTSSDGGSLPSRSATRSSRYRPGGSTRRAPTGAPSGGGGGSRRGPPPPRARGGGGGADPGRAEPPAAPPRPRRRGGGAARTAVPRQAPTGP